MDIIMPMHMLIIMLVCFFMAVLPSFPIASIGILAIMLAPSPGLVNHHFTFSLPGGKLSSRFWTG